MDPVDRITPRRSHLSWVALPEANGSGLVLLPHAHSEQWIGGKFLNVLVSCAGESRW